VRLFGRVELDKKAQCWRIDAERHVAQKLQRLFAQTTGTARGTVELSNIPENCRDLAWFLLRYPMEVADEEVLARGAAEHIERIETLDRIVAATYVPRTFALADCVEQREYQRVAAEVYLKNRFLLLADDVGLGKSVVAIFSFTDSRTLPALVVTLTHLCRQWANFIARFAPALAVHVAKQGTPYPLPLKDGRPPDVLIMNYHKLRGWAGELAGYVRSVVFDECQELRRSESLKYEAALHIRDNTEFRLGLSATPIYNYGSEFWNVASALKRDVLGTYKEFERAWCHSAYYDRHVSVIDPAAFGTHCREQFIMLRRTRKEVARELPEVSRIPFAVDSDTAALDEVRDAAGELARIILRRVEAEQSVRWRAGSQFDMLMRQATGIAKAPYVADFVRLLVESGERVVLYGWHREVYGVWLSRLADLNPAMYTGSESPAAKARSVETFLAGDARVLIVSLRAGAGLDGLQEASRTVVFGELDWSPGVHEQCIGRVHRDGQQQAVVAYYLVSETGADPIIAETLGIKRAQVEGIRDPDAPLVEKLDHGGANLRKLAEQFLGEGQAAS